MAAADQLNQLGHRVKVFERDTTPGGLLTYGIPDYKLEKDVIARRVQVMEDEGIVFQCNTEIGKDLTLEELQESFDAVLLAIGSKVPRDIPAQGRGTGGVHFAMDFLTQNNKAVAGEHVSAPPISAEGKTVLVIGGGDTDPTASERPSAKAPSASSKPPSKPSLPTNADTNPWPQWPQTLKTSSSHEEGCERALGTQRRGGGCQCRWRG